MGSRFRLEGVCDLEGSIGSQALNITAGQTAWREAIASAIPLVPGNRSSNISPS